jgi:hypothetical protein
MRRAIIAFLTLAAISPCLAIAKYSGGTGEPNTPYQIANVADLLTLGADINDYNKCFIMTADLDLDPCLPGGQVFTTAVIGRVREYGFIGVFDGAGHKITNLTIDANEPGCIGLFGWIGDGNEMGGVKVKNLIIEDINIVTHSSGDVGGLAGCSENYSDVNNCYSTGNIIIITSGDYWGGSFDIGGLVGLNYYAGNISNCFSSVNIICGDWCAEVGGLAGRNWGGDINNCFATGTVIGGASTQYIGGLVGLNRSSHAVIRQSYSTGNVSCGVNSVHIGGLVGCNMSSTISQCYSSSAVAGGSGSNKLGGLVGGNDGGGDKIINCYSTGDVSGDNLVGGLVGKNISSIRNCYSTGTVTGISSLGGLIGNNDTVGVRNCYFLDTAGPNNGIGTPLTDTNMKQQSSFVIWDFVWETANGPNDVWAICEGVSYPKLAWQFIAGDSDNDKDVDFIDFALLGNKWMQADSNLYCGGTDLTGNNWVDFDDLKVFCDNWLEEL